MSWQLNARAQQLLDSLDTRKIDALRIARHDLPGGGTVWDCGCQAEGGLAAGLWLARLCLSDLGEVTLTPGTLAGTAWPHLQVTTDHPTIACLCSQYAGWQLSAGKFFAMGSGPMRAAAGREELFTKLDYRESADHVVGILEGRKLPTPEVIALIADKCSVPTPNVTLLVAPTASLAGTVQVVSRMVETALHKLFELGFDVHRIRSATGIAPLSPVAQDDLTGIGLTNDAILYGASVTLWVRGDDASLQDIGPQVPACASASYGQPFLKIFEAAGRDFYKIDPHLFSPAHITFHNLDTGHIHRFGQLAPHVLQSSFQLHQLH